MDRKVIPIRAKDHNRREKAIKVIYRTAIESSKNRGEREDVPSCFAHIFKDVPDSSLITAAAAAEPSLQSGTLSVKYCAPVRYMEIVRMRMKKNQ